MLKIHNSLKLILRPNKCDIKIEPSVVLKKIKIHGRGSSHIMVMAIMLSKRITTAVIVDCNRFFGIMDNSQYVPYPHIVVSF